MVRPTREIGPRTILSLGLGGVTGGGGSGGGGGDDPFLQYVLTTEGGRDVVSVLATLGATQDIDPSDGNVFSGTLAEDCAITLLGPDVRGGSVSVIELYLTEDGTGGWTPTFDADGGVIVWPGGSAPDHDTTADSLTRYVFESIDDGLSWYGLQVGSGSSGSDLTVEDEGTPLATFATSLDFVGAGVTASGATGDKTITVPGMTAVALAEAGVVGPILIADDHSTPLVFGDLLQTEAGDDFLYADVGLGV